MKKYYFLNFIFSLVFLCSDFALASFRCESLFFKDSEEAVSEANDLRLRKFIFELFSVNGFADFKMFNARLDTILSHFDEGLTIEDKKTQKALKKLKSIFDDQIADRSMITRTELDEIAFSIRKIKLLVDKEFLAKLTWSQRRESEGLHQAILSEGLIGYMQLQGIKVVDRWSLSHPFRSIWYNVFLKWSGAFGVDFFVGAPIAFFPKAKASAINFDEFVELAAHGDQAGPHLRLKAMYKPVLNSLNSVLNVLFISGMLAFVGDMAYTKYFDVQEQKVMIVSKTTETGRQVKAVTQQAIESIANQRYLEWKNSFLQKSNGRLPSENTRIFIKNLIENQEGQKVTVD